MAVSAPQATPSDATSDRRWMPYYGWMIVVMSALAMLATLPGRTHGLGIITERLLSDPVLNLDRVQFGELNFWATILGATFCFPCGKLLDRYGARLVLMLVSASLGLVVLGMTKCTGLWTFFIAITLTRGLGQSALSVVSLSMPGKWFSRRLGLAMGVYTILMAIAFISAFVILGKLQEASWQSIWSGLGFGLVFGMAPLGWLLVRNTPESCGLTIDGGIQATDAPPSLATGYSVRDALKQPAFWAFALATSVYGLITSGTSLFNEHILRELGFDRQTYYTLLTWSTGLGLLGNFLAGTLVHWLSLRAVMGMSMACLAGALFWLPFVSTFPHLILYAMGMSIGGGMITVVFFTAFGKVFGRLYLGQIQGIAQMLTVFASAMGPVLLAYSKRDLKSYMPFFTISGGVVAALGIWAILLRMPAPSTPSTPVVEPVSVEA